MKTLTTLTAVAALIAGISIANAQAPSGSMGAKAAVKGSAAFCVETKPGSLNCKYASLDACQKDPKLRNRRCMPNPGPGTTGAK